MEIKNVEFLVTDQGKFFDAIDTLCEMCQSHGDCHNCAVTAIRQSATFEDEE